MKRVEVHEVFQAFYDPEHKAHPGDYRNLVVAPFESVQAVVSKLKYAWTEDQIRLVAMIIGHVSSTQTIELMDEILSSENMIRDITQSVRPAATSAIVMHAVTFSLGVALTLSAVILAMQDQLVVSGLLGGLGITSFLYIFFRQPIRGVQRSISHLVQLEVIYNGYLKQLLYWKAYERSNDVRVKPNILAEIDYCTRHTLYLIEKCSEGRQITPPKRLVFKPLQAAATPRTHVPPKMLLDKPIAEKAPNTDSSVQFEDENPAARIPLQTAATPQTHVPPKIFVEKTMILDKMPVAEKTPTADSSVQFEDEAPAARIPPKLSMDAKLPAFDKAAFDSTQSVEGGEAVVTSDWQNEDSGTTPFLLATPHHASNWQTVDLFTVEELLAENERKAVEIRQAIDELKDLPPSRDPGTQEYRRLEELHEQQRTVEAEHEILAARRDTLTQAS